MGDTFVMSHFLLQYKTETMTLNRIPVTQIHLCDASYAQTDI